jgi:hypothetical protein
VETTHLNFNNQKNASKGGAGAPRTLKRVRQMRIAFERETVSVSTSVHFSGTPHFQPDHFRLPNIGKIQTGLSASAERE